MRLQVTIDCGDPHRLAAFYSAAFGYLVENHEQGITQLLASGVLHDDEVIEVDGHLFFAGAAACTDPSGDTPRLHLQQVPEAKAAKNRVHLDFQCGNDADRDAVVARAIGAGGRRIGAGSQGPVHSWVVVADPEGNELCISN